MNYIFGYFIIGLICAIVAIFKKENVITWTLFWPLMLFYELLFKIFGVEDEPK